jgi:hypothetical protein
LKYNRKIIVGLSDFHSGHKLGLLNPQTILEDEDEEGNITKWNPKLSEAQKYLWEDIYQPSVDSIIQLAEKDDICVLYVGDITHGNHYISQQVSTRISDQILIAEANLSPLLEAKQTKMVRIIKGTGVHEFGEGSSAVTIDKMLRNKYPKKDIKSLYHGLLSIGKFYVDYTHHGSPPGSRDWLKGNEARYYLRSIMYAEIKSGNKPANLYLRGHYHEPILEWLSMEMLGEEYDSWMCILPSMCMLDDHARKVTRSQFKITNGIYAFELMNDTIYKIHKFKKTIDIRTKEDIL